VSIIPSRAEELMIAKTTHGMALPKLEHVLDGERVKAYQDLVRRVPVQEHLSEFIVDLVRRTRPHSADAPSWLKPLVGWGAGPRAVQYLGARAKARAALQGSYMVRRKTWPRVVESVLRHSRDDHLHGGERWRGFEAGGGATL